MRMKRKVFAYILCGVIALGLIGCQKDSNMASSEASTEVGSTEITIESPTEADPEETESMTAREQMIARSLVSMGNNYRMKKLIERAQAGEELTVGFIGGSITQGMNATSKECYAYLTYQYFAETYSTMDKVSYVNAGIAGTPSILGNIRSERDLLQYKPDLIVIEFAVNDGQDLYHKYSYESLVQRCLDMEHEPVVILLFTVTQEGYTCQQHMSVTGYANAVPMISVPDAILPELEAGTMQWSDYSNDGVHPDKNGHALIRDLFAYYFEQVEACEEVDEPYKRPSNTPHKPWFKLLNFYDASNISSEKISEGDFAQKTTIENFPNGWVHEKDGGTEAFSFTFESNCLYVVYKQVNSATNGAVDVYVDGEFVKSINANDSSGWNNPVAEFIFRDSMDEWAEHTVEIRMSEGSEELAFTILGFGY